MKGTTMAGRRRKTDEPADLVDQMAEASGKPDKSPPPDPLDVTGNGADYDASADRLAQIVSRLENIDDEISLKREDRKLVLAEAKATGYSTKTIGIVMRRRKRRRDELSEEEAMVDLYETAIESRLKK